MLKLRYLPLLALPFLAPNVKAQDTLSIPQLQGLVTFYKAKADSLEACRAFLVKEDSLAAKTYEAEKAAYEGLETKYQKKGISTKDRAKLDQFRAEKLTPASEKRIGIITLKIKEMIDWQEAFGKYIMFSNKLKERTEQKVKEAEKRMQDTKQEIRERQRQEKSGIQLLDFRNC